MSKYIEFVEKPSISTKTKVWELVRKDNAENRLGLIGWYPAWRGYVFSPPINTHTFFERHCLRDIADFIEEQNGLHRAALKAKKEQG